MPTENPPPLELEYAFQCNSYPGSLPNSGGLRDQPVGLMTRMRASYAVWKAFKDYFDSNMSPEWTMKHHDKWELIVKVMDLRAKREAEET